MTGPMTGPRPGPGAAALGPDGLGRGATPRLPRRLVGAALVGLPLGLAIVAEAAWISVLAGLVQEFALREPTLGIAPLTGFVAAGVLSARQVGGRLGERWPAVAAGLSLVAGAIGWLSSPDTVAALRNADPADAFALNPGGWLAALAFARGFAHARLPLSEATVAHVLGAGVPLIAAAAIVGGMVTEPFRGRFLGDAIVASIVFVTTATLALALTRLTAVGSESGFDWRRNPTWAGLLAVLVVATAVLAIATSSIAAPAIAFVVGASIAPLLLVGLIVGFNRGTVRILAIAVVVAVAFAVLMSLIGGRPVPTLDLGGGTTSEVATGATGETAAVGGGLMLILAVIAIILLARLWMRRLPLVEDDVLETRMIDRGGASPRHRRRGAAARRRPDPVDAVAAYLALVDELADRPGFRREPAETPAEHARRLREAGGSALGLDLLAADYALARFGGVRLSASEDRRAVSRWRSLRRLLAGHDRGPRGRPQRSA